MIILPIFEPLVSGIRMMVVIHFLFLQLILHLFLGLLDIPKFGQTHIMKMFERRKRFIWTDLRQEILLVNHEKDDVPIAIVVLTSFLNEICVETYCSEVAAGLQIEHDLVLTEEALLLVIQQEVEVLVEDFDCSTFDKVDVCDFVVETQDCVILFVDLATYVT